MKLALLRRRIYEYNYGIFHSTKRRNAPCTGNIKSSCSQKTTTKAQRGRRRQSGKSESNFFSTTTSISSHQIALFKNHINAAVLYMRVLRAHFNMIYRLTAYIHANILTSVPPRFRCVPLVCFDVSLYSRMKRNNNKNRVS